MHFRHLGLTLISFRDFRRTFITHYTCVFDKIQSIWVSLNIYLFCAIKNIFSLIHSMGCFDSDGQRYNPLLRGASKSRFHRSQYKLDRSRRSLL